MTSFNYSSEILFIMHINYKLDFCSGRARSKC